MEIDITRPKKLYRYSEKQWLDRSLKFGEFRLRPASEYRSMEDSEARTDDELNRRFKLRNPSITHLKTGRSIIPNEDVIKSSKTDSDYLVLCLATIYSDHFYQDFEGSDACLIIHETNKFFNRLYKKITSVIPSRWGAIDGPVTYGRSSELGAPFSKPDKFLFQFEWRFVCFPIPPRETCEPTIVKIGSIEDIAEVIHA